MLSIKNQRKIPMPIGDILRLMIMTAIKAATTITPISMLVSMPTAAKHPAAKSQPGRAFFKNRTMHHNANKPQA